MVHKKATPVKREREKTEVIYGAHAAWKRNAALHLPPDGRTGGYEGFGSKELKFLDLEGGGVVNDTLANAARDPATVLCLNAMATGDGPSSRIGRKIMNKSLTLLIEALNPVFFGAAPPDRNGLRLIVYVDTQTNKVQAQGTDVLVNAPSGGEPYLALKNLENDLRFTILCDKSFDLGFGAAVNVSDSIRWAGRQKSMQVTIPLNFPTTFIGSQGTIANIADNSLHVLLIASNNTTAHLHYTSRLRYTG